MIIEQQRNRHTAGQLRIAIVVSGVGHIVHNLEEFGVSGVFVGQTLFPAAVTVAFYLAARRPTRPYLVALTAWALIVILLGGGSVFPWPFLPFVPAQTVSHYLAHLAYALLQVPALVFAWRSLRAASGSRTR